MENNGNDKEIRIMRESAMRASSSIVAGYAQGKIEDTSTLANMAVEIADALFAWIRGSGYIQGTEPGMTPVTQGVFAPSFQKVVPQPTETRVAVPENTESVMDFVTGVSLPKKGIKENGEKYERYVINLHGGTDLHTFSKTDAQIAQMAQSKGAAVHVVFVPNSKFKQKKIVSIKEQPVA